MNTTPTSDRANTATTSSVGRPATTNGATDRATDRAGGIGALIAAAAFIFGIALYATSLTDFASGDQSVGESVSFLVDNEGIVSAWYLVMYLVFGVAIIPLTRALHQRLRPSHPGLADIGAVFGYIWAGLMFATGMIANIGIEAVADLAATDSAAAEGLWLSVDTISNGLGGGNELVGGAWVLLVSLAALRSATLPKTVNVIGLISAVAGLVTVVPGLEDVGIVFGLGLIVWFAALGVSMLRSPKVAGR